MVRISVPLPDLVSAPVAPLMMPVNVEPRLSVLLPTVSVKPAPMATLPVFRDDPAFVSFEICWLAPTLKMVPSATSTKLALPIAVALLEVSWPPVMLICVPAVTVLAAVPKIKVPLPCLVMVRAVPPSLRAPMVVV